MSRLKSGALLLLLAACSPYTPPPPPEPPLPDLPPARVSPSGPALQDQVTGLTARLQAVSVVDERVVWVSGTLGSFGVSVNGGRSWRTGVVAGADSLEFRDVQGVDAKTAYLLAAGPGTASRIYKTTDAGQNWQLQFVNREPRAFFDCFAFWDPQSGIAWSDNVDGRFPVARTANGGQRWTVAYVDGATEGEGAFAASGTCVITHGKDAAWVATGAGKEARLFRTGDRAATWTTVSTPMVQGTSTTGHTSIAFRDDLNGLAAGGDIADQNARHRQRRHHPGRRRQLDPCRSAQLHRGGLRRSLRARGGRTGRRGRTQGGQLVPGRWPHLAGSGHAGVLERRLRQP